MNDDKIRLTDLGRAALKLLPETPRTLRATFNMATLRPNSTQSIGRLLERQAQKTPDKACLLFEGRRWSYREFNDWADRIATVFQEQGVERGDTVGLLMENCPELLACVAATVKLGAVAGMLNPNQRGEVLHYSAGVIKPRLIVVSAECLPMLQSAFPKRPRGACWLWVGEGAPPRGLSSLSAACEKVGGSGTAVTAEIKASDPCYLIFTSGTTGLPKAAVMTHLRWLRSGYGMGQIAMHLNSDDVFYCPLPFYHNSALTLCWSSVLAAGATLAMARKFSASRFWDDIRSTGSTAFIYIGELCRYLLANAPSTKDRTHSIRVMIGNGLRPEIWDEFQQRFGIAHICEFYGSSEGNLVFVNAFGMARTAGFTPMPYAIVAFDAANEQPERDARGFMHRVASGEAGLLITEVSKNNPFDGYTDAAANEAKLFRNAFKKGDTWINSGDLVREQGFRHIAFVDRVGDTFRWKGENVATTEVEGAVGAIGGIEQATVYGVTVAHTDGRAGMAAIVLKPGARFDGAKVARQLVHALPAYAVPLFIRVIGAHETTATFKIRKVELKQQGFDPAVIKDPLFVLLDRKKGYVKLTQSLHAGLLSGEQRL